MHPAPPRLVLPSLLTALCTARLLAVDLTWDDQAGDDAWGTAGNWNPNQTPAGGDSLTFAAAGADGSGANAVTSRLTLDAPSPFPVLNLVFANASTNETHHVDLSGRNLRVTGELRAGFNVAQTRATLTNGGIDLGTGPTSRSGNIAIGYRAAGSTPSAIDGRLALGAGANLFAHANFVDIGRRFADTGVLTAGRADFSAASGAYLDATRVLLGTIGNAGGLQGMAAGTLVLPTGAGTTATLLTPTLWLSNSDSAANNGAANLSEIQLGPATTLNVDDLAVGRFKGRGALRFATGVTGGTLDLAGQTSASANLRIAYNAIDTGTIAEGTVNLQGGVFNASLNELAIGVHNANVGGARGSLLMGFGTVTANSVVLARPDNAGNSTVDGNTTALLRLNGGDITVSGTVSDGNGTSTVQVDSGRMTVAGGFKSDVLRVGYNNVTGFNTNGTLRVDGHFTAGTATQPLDLGRSETPNTTPIEAITGTLDLRNAPSATLLASDLRMGSISVDGNTAAYGILHLSAAGPATISATSIHVGQSGASGNIGGFSEIHFGGVTNTVRVDSFHVGRQKSNGKADIRPGGTLLLRGLAGEETNLFIANNDVSTGTGTFGTFDLSAGTLHATLNQLVVGRHHSTGGNARGHFRMGAGTVTARGLLVADPGFGGASSAPAATMGTVTVAGGTLSVAGDTVDGGGVSRLEVPSGLFRGQGNFNLDSLSIGAASGPTGRVDVVGFVELRAQTLALEPTGFLNLLQVDSPFQVTNATFAAGSQIDGPADVSLVSVSPDTASASTWIAATNTWDDATHAHWDRGLPAGALIQTGQGRVVVQAQGTLTDLGLTAGSTNWTVQVVTGAGGSVSLVRAGPPLHSGRAIAEIPAGAIEVTRPGDLVLGDVVGSEAHASGLVVRGGLLRVTGNVGEDGGNSLVLVDGGNLQVAAGLDVDQLRVGYNGLTGTLQSGGDVRIGTGVETIDLGRRETGDLTTSGTADFSTATSVNLQAQHIRLGSLLIGGNTSSRGQLFFPATNTAVNTVIADTLTLGDSGAAANPVTSEVHLGGGSSDLRLDTLSVGRRKSFGLLRALPGAQVLLSGRNGATTTLMIGVNDVTNTGTETRGTLDLTGVEFNAALGPVVIGLHGSGSGSGKGTWILDGGAVTASSVLLADASASGTSDTPGATTGRLQVRSGSLAVAGDVTDGGGISDVAVEGGTLVAGRLLNLDTLALRSGTLRASAITNTTGTVAFDFSGGLLAAASISPGPTVLTQTGGILDPRPAGGRTVVRADYQLNAGGWQAEIGGFTNTFVDVRGALTLGAGSTLNLSVSGDAFTNAFEIASYASLTGVFASTNALPAGWTLDYNYQGRSRIALVQIASPVPTFTVTVENGQVVVRWTTDDETDILGFHIERLDGTPAWQRLTPTRIPALGGPGGHAYAHTDTTAVPGRRVSYRVIVVRTGDEELPKGPFSALAAQNLVLASPQAVAAPNATLSWASNEGSVYSLLRSPSLETPAWTPVATGLAATPPLNVFTDTTANGDRFYYRVEEE